MKTEAARDHTTPPNTPAACLVKAKHLPSVKHSGVGVMIHYELPSLPKCSKVKSFCLKDKAQMSNTGQ